MATESMHITPLGSGREVGRSCHLLKFRGCTILLDCGIHPGYPGEEGLPYFDHCEPEDIDILLITHFHLDHAGSLPYFTERTGFKGRIFMTHPTRAVLRLLLFDCLRLINVNSKGNSSQSQPNSRIPSASESIFTEHELKSCIDKVELLDYHSVMSIGPIKFWAYNAGHVLGACMFMIEIADKRVLYTGDYSMEDDRHLMAAEIPTMSVDVLIAEGTYGVMVHPTRVERERDFTNFVGQTVRGGGRVLLPVFALGRAQELLLILDEYWQQNPDLHKVPIYYASKMASKALRVFQTYVNMMNGRIREMVNFGNPFLFSHIYNLKSLKVDDFPDKDPSVVFASPGMMQSGVSRKLFDKWCTDPKNGVLIAGYAIENTMAKDLEKHPEEVTTMEGKIQKLNCSVKFVSFSAHVDGTQNWEFIERVRPDNIVLVHGQETFLERLAVDLRKNTAKWKNKPSVNHPENAKTIEFKFEIRRSAKVIGALADNDQLSAKNKRDKSRNYKKGDDFQGVMFTKNFQSKIASADDLAEYSPLRVGSVTQKLYVPFVGCDIGTLRLFLHEMFSSVSEDPSSASPDGNGIGTVFKLHSLEVTVRKNACSIEWESSPVGDLLADSVVAIIMHAQSAGASIRMSGTPCKEKGGGEGATTKTEESAEEIKKKRLALAERLLKEQFSNVVSNLDSGTFVIKFDKKAKAAASEDGSGEILCGVKIVFTDDNSGCQIRVRCENDSVGKSVKECLSRMATASGPLQV